MDSTGSLVAASKAFDPRRCRADRYPHTAIDYFCRRMGDIADLCRRSDDPRPQHVASRTDHERRRCADGASDS